VIPECGRKRSAKGRIISPKKNAMEQPEKKSNRLFEMGQLYLTPGAAELPTKEVWEAFKRHIRGDWGVIVQEDLDANEQALVDGTRILSVYQTKSGVKFWIITEADRSSTTVLLPGEY
jgi:hypothetical protein